MTDHPSLADEVTKDFQHTLNKHGYGFHFAVLKNIQDRYQGGRSFWQYEAAEFPVEINGAGTRIDFILKHRGVVPIFMLAECKRVDPALGRWCFIRAPSFSAQRRAEYSFFERAEWNRDSVPPLRSQAYPYSCSVDDPYHIAVDVRSPQKGDGAGGNKSAIEDAATQVLRGQSGFVNFLARSPKFIPGPTHFLPVIFTTAELWASTTRLSEAELASGHIDLTGKPMTSKPWLLYQYVLSPGIKHQHIFGRADTLGETLDADYLRTIAIVSVSGIDLFLEWAGDLILSR